MVTIWTSSFLEVALRHNSFISFFDGQDRSTINAPFDMSDDHARDLCRAPPPPPQECLTGDINSAAATVGEHGAQNVGRGDSRRENGKWQGRRKVK